jgi:hypothetical protein
MGLWHIFSRRKLDEKLVLTVGGQKCALLPPLCAVAINTKFKTNHNFFGGQKSENKKHSNKIGCSYRGVGYYDTDFT